MMTTNQKIQNNQKNFFFKLGGGAVPFSKRFWVIFFWSGFFFWYLHLLILCLHYVCIFDDHLTKRGLYVYIIRNENIQSQDCFQDSNNQAVICSRRYFVYGHVQPKGPVIIYLEGAGKVGGSWKNWKLIEGGGGHCFSGWSRRGGGHDFF